MPPRAGLTLDLIVRKAAEVADELGPERLTFAEVARRLGVRPPSLYNHVGSLEDLRREVTIAALRELARRLERAAVGRAADDALRAMLEAQRAFGKEHPGLYRATLMAPDPQDREWTAVAGGLVGTLLRVLQPFRLPPDDAVHVVRGFRAIGHGFVLLELDGGFGMPQDCDESYRWLMSMFLRGLHSLAGGGGEAGRGGPEQDRA